MKKNQLFIIGATLVLVIALLSNVMAFSVAIPYGNNMPLVIAPGESKDFQLTFQSESKAVLRPSILSGSEVASLVNEEKDYSVNPGALVPADVRISVPQDAADGKEYTVTFAISDVTPSTNEGTVKVSLRSQVTMTVIVQKPAETAPAPVTTPVSTPEAPAANNTLWIVLVVIIVIVIAILAYFMMARKGKKK